MMMNEINKKEHLLKEMSDCLYALNKCVISGLRCMTVAQRTEATEKLNEKEINSLVIDCLDCSYRKK